MKLGVSYACSRDFGVPTKLWEEECNARSEAIGEAVEGVLKSGSCKTGFTASCMLGGPRGGLWWSKFARPRRNALGIICVMESLGHGKPRSGSCHCVEPQRVARSYRGSGRGPVDLNRSPKPQRGYRPSSAKLGTVSLFVQDSERPSSGAGRVGYPCLLRTAYRVPVRNLRYLR